MKRRIRNRRMKRRGAIVVLAALLMIVFVAMIAFTLDYGYILTMKTDLQRAADAAALAAVQDLVPDSEGNQDLDQVRASVTSYVRDNLSDSGFTVEPSDITIARFDPATIYTNLTLLNDGILDTVRVTLRRDGNTNSAVPLFFARALGVRDATVTATATAVLQKPSVLLPGVGVLPFAVPKSEWDKYEKGDNWTIYGDGKITDSGGDDIAGNWGTVDIGNTGNSTNEQGLQIENGLTQDDIDALYNDQRIAYESHIESSEDIWLNADTGVSGGLRHSLTAVQGATRVVPLYNETGGSAAGNNLEFKVVDWGIARVMESRFKGSNNTYVKIEKTYGYDGKLAPSGDLTAEEEIEGAYSSPILIE